MLSRDSNLDGPVSELNDAAGNVSGLKEGSSEFTPGRHPEFLRQLGRKVQQQEVHRALDYPVLSNRGKHLLDGEVGSLFLKKSLCFRLQV
jgi:hypothetical protein